MSAASEHPSKYGGEKGSLSLYFEVYAMEPSRGKLNSKIVSLSDYSSISGDALYTCWSVESHGRGRGG